MKKNSYYQLKAMFLQKGTECIKIQFKEILFDKTNSLTR